jgi:follistatin-related protein 5
VCLLSDGFVIIQCREPVTNRPSGQLILDYLTDAVVSVKSQINGRSYISPDSRHLITVENDHLSDDVILIVQQITVNGLKFQFDVRTTLNITDVAFFESSEQHSYDLFASASDKEDILFLNLWTGKVEIITGIGTMENKHFNEANLGILPPVRAITSGGE